MASFESSGVTIDYDVEGEGPPIVLVHGFASSRAGNWREPGWYDALGKAGRKVVALDCRGHGASGKPHDPASYGTETMAEDVIRLMDHLGIEKADLMGYSMGGGIAARLLVDHADRFNAVILAGIGAGLVRGMGGRSGIADALEAEDKNAITDPVAKGFRIFAERSGNDLRALAAVQRGPRTPISEEALGRAARPVLVVVGEKDDLVGDAGPVVEAIPGAALAIVPGKDHITAVADDHYKSAVLDFLAREGLGAAPARRSAE